MMHTEPQRQCEDQKASFEEIGSFNIWLFRCSACRFHLFEMNRNKFQKLRSSSTSRDVGIETLWPFQLKRHQVSLRNCSVLIKPHTEQNFSAVKINLSDNFKICGWHIPFKNA